MSATIPPFESVWATGAEFLAGFIPGNPAQFFHPVTPEWNEPPFLTVGVLLSVVLRFEDRGARFHVHARVVEKRLTGPRRGIVLELLVEERNRLELVLTCVGGESFPYFKRRYPRTPARLPVRVTGPDGVERDMVTTSVNEGGMHLGLPEAEGDAPGPLRGGSSEIPLFSGELEASARVKLAITWPTGAVALLNARVTEVIPRGPQRGLGIELLFASAEQREATASEVALVRAKHGMAP